MQLNDIVKYLPTSSVGKIVGFRDQDGRSWAKLDFTGAARDNSPGLKLIDRATAGILVDMDNNTVLWAKNPSKPVPIASLSKIMTIMLAYEIAM